MKKSIASLVLTAIVLIGTSTNSFAGEPLKKGPTIKAAFVLPQGEYGKFNEVLRKDFKVNTASMGYGFQMGTLYYLTAFGDAETMKLGIDVTWLGVSYQAVNYDIVGSDRSFDAYYINVYPEVGPMFSYSPVDKMALDLSVKLSPTIGVTGAETVPGRGYFGTGFGLRYTPSFYFRYSLLLAGVEYSMGNVSYSYTTNSYDNPPGSNGPVEQSVLRVVLGVKF